MRKVLCGLVSVLAAVFGIVCVAGASAPEEAKESAEKGARYARAGGKDKAVAEFNNPKGKSVKGDLYILANGLSGNCLVKGATPQLAGTNQLGLKD
jgi:cytochrome c